MQFVAHLKVEAHTLRKGVQRKQEKIFKCFLEVLAVQLLEVYRNMIFSSVAH